MSRSSNSLRGSDVVTTPIRIKYTSSYDCSTLGSTGMEVLIGVNGPVTTTGSVSDTTLNYRSIRHLYYSNYLTGSNPISASSADNFLQSSAANGTADADIRLFPTESGAFIGILSIPRNVYGEQISRNSFLMTSSQYEIVDDGNGNLIDIRNQYYVSLSYYLPEFSDWYVYQAAFHVGNIIYRQGMVVVTNPAYTYILPYSPVAYPDTALFNESDTPKTVNVIANDYSGSGTLNGSSVVLLGGDVALFTNNLDGTVTLNTTTPGIYTTNYTVESDLTGSCSLESNEATITVFVTSEVVPTTTTTTTTTTTVPTTTTTTTSTTTTTTTAAPTTTTTTTSTSTTTTVPTTTSTTTTTTTVPPTTTTTTTTTSTTTTTTTNPFDNLSGSFDVTNGGGSISDINVVLSGYGTGQQVTIGNTQTFNTSGQISNPNSAVFSITAVGGTDTVTVNSNSLSCTNASVTVTGSGTTTVLITITPTNYNLSTDTLSGNITVTTS